MQERRWSKAIQDDFNKKLEELEVLIKAHDNTPLHQEFFELRVDLGEEKLPRTALNPPIEGSEIVGDEVYTLTVAPGSVELLLEMARKGDGAAISILRMLSSRQIRDGIELTNQMRDIIVCLIWGLFAIRNRDGRESRREKTTRRDRLIVELMLYGLEDHALRAIRNDESRLLSSAADYTERALSTSSYPGVSFQTCKDAWQNPRVRGWTRITRGERDRTKQRFLDRAAGIPVPKTHIGVTTLSGLFKHGMAGSAYVKEVTAPSSEPTAEVADTDSQVRRER